ncbi:MAG: isoleucine--tRNA ligase [Candidatus Omnitrophica bacterium]|nr:isoleucine--tRNA ligase [Candidatus Omnitrophota bacterium]
MDYKNTLNLPKATFPMKANLPSREPEILKFWEEEDIYSAIRKLRKKKKYVLHDGPPYANGNIHMGHALNKILKDIVVRYKTMRGFDSPYVPGWDCHGLPVEHQLLKELGISKGDIDQVEFRKKARDYAMKFVAIQREEFKRLGVFGDWQRPYLTLSHEYEAEIIKSFSTLVNEGYIYRDLKPVNWCTSCETALAEAEVEYADHVSPSVYVKFKLLKEQKPEVLKRESLFSALSHLSPKQLENTHFLIWTTTPWTLLANVAVALHPELGYAILEVGKEKWIMAVSLIESVMKKVGKEYKIIAEIKGSEFDGVLAQHPFIDRESKVVLANYVSREEGTGCVHTAPGHGQEDYFSGKKYNLGMVMPVNEKGCFDDTCGEFSGLNVFKANPKIIEAMKKNGSCVFTEDISHSYPHCWRCKKAIIFRATYQWFMNVDHKDLRKKILKGIQKKVKWYPAAGEGRISTMVENRPDWCLSRQRYWGVPIPAFYCKACGRTILEPKLIDRVAALTQKHGVDVWFSKKAKDILPKNFKCPKCKSSAIGKENDILDVWFESGVSHQAVLKTNALLDYPCQLYLEGSDQHRGWFQSAIITAVAIDDEPPYESVLTHGFTVDGQGKKMSKSLGNVIAPQEIMKKYGADILRLWVASSNYSDDVRISEEIIKRQADAYRKIRNTFRYLLSNLYDFDPVKDLVTIKKIEEIDRWMLSRLGHILKEVQQYYDNYLFHKAYRLIYNFCVYEVSSLYLDISKDRMYTFKKDSPARRSGQTVTYEILNCLVKVIAPILSFTSEEVWQNSVFSKKCKSVHFADWPVNDAILKKWIDPELDKKWQELCSVREPVLKALESSRMKGDIGGSLEARVVLSTNNKNLNKLLKDNISVLAMLFIVSQVEVTDKAPSGAIEIDGISVFVAKADGEKCKRCWQYSKSVGTIKEHPEICKKCFHNI